MDRGGRKTSFAYKLEIPQEPGEVQNELQIKKEASYTLSMKVLLVYGSFAPCSCFLLACICSSSMSDTVGNNILQAFGKFLLRIQANAH